MKKQNKLGLAVVGFIVLIITGISSCGGKATPTGNASPIASGSAHASAGGSPTFTATSAPTPAAVVAKAKATVAVGKLACPERHTWRWGIEPRRHLPERQRSAGGTPPQYGREG